MEKNMKNRFPKPPHYLNMISKKCSYMFFWKIPNIPMTDPPKLYAWVLGNRCFIFVFRPKRIAPMIRNLLAGLVRKAAQDLLATGTKHHTHTHMHCTAPPARRSSPEVQQSRNPTIFQLSLSGSALISEAATKFAALRERPTRKMQREKGAATEGAGCCI